MAATSPFKFLSEIQSATHKAARQVLDDVLAKMHWQFYANQMTYPQWRVCMMVLFLERFETFQSDEQLADAIGVTPTLIQRARSSEQFSELEDRLGEVLAELGLVRGWEKRSDDEFEQDRVARQFYRQAAGGGQSSGKAAAELLQRRMPAQAPPEANVQIVVDARSLAAMVEAEQLEAKYREQQKQIND